MRGSRRTYPVSGMGLDPATDTLIANAAVTVGENLLSNLFGGGRQQAGPSAADLAAIALAQQQAQQRTTTMLVVGGLAVAGVLAFVLLRPR